MKKNKKLKMLVLTEDFIPIYGGITSVVEKSSLALSDDIDITIGTMEVIKKDRENFKEPDVPYKIVRARGGYNKITTNMQFLRFNKKFKKEIEKEKYDVIHCHFPLEFYKYALKLGKKTNTPVVITAHSIFTPDIKANVKFNFLANFITKIIVRRLNKADKVFCVTQFCKDHLVKYGLREDSVVLYNGVDMKKDEGTKNVDVNKMFGLEKDDFVISAIGRLAKVKNVPMLINSVNTLKDLNLKMKVLIIGDGAEGENIKELIEKNNLEDVCIMTGAIKDRAVLAEIYRRTNLVGFVSVGDSAGLIQTEAAYYSKPTLALENTAISESMTNRKNGLIAQNTQDSIAEQILFAYNNPEKLLEIGNMANKTLYRTYFDDKVIDEILEKYQCIIDEFNKKNR